MAKREEDSKAPAVDVVEIRGDVEEDFRSEPQQGPSSDHVRKSEDTVSATTETTSQKPGGELEEDVATLETHRETFGTELTVAEGQPVKMMESLPPVPVGTVRGEAIHLHGVDEMSTEDVLELFSLYGPINVEWIDDKSCELGQVSCHCHVT